MAQSDAPSEPDSDWSAFVEEVNESFADAIEDNVEAQATFVESWLDALDDSRVTSSEMMAETMESYARAYETWMRAAEEHVELASDALAGEDVPPEDFRDMWLTTANQAFKDVMETSAFAAATGETVEDALELQRQLDETAEETLRSFGFATGGEVEEVGARLVELERRQHAVESKLDRILDELEEANATEPEEANETADEVAQ